MRRTGTLQAEILRQGAAKKTNEMY